MTTRAIPECSGYWTERGVGGRRRQCGHRRERHNDGKPPTPRRHSGLRRHVEPIKNSTISRFLRVSQYYDRREQ